LPAWSKRLTVDENVPDVLVSVAPCGSGRARTGGRIGHGRAHPRAELVFSNTCGGVMHITVGAVASRLTTPDLLAEPPADLASHVKVVPAVSEATGVASQRTVDTPDSAPATSQVTVTSDTCQPFFPGVLVTVGVIVGGVMSSPAGRRI
jgi:hypothetical protein